MDFTIPEELKVIQAKAATYVGKELLPLEKEYLRGQAYDPRTLVPGLKAAGLWAPAVPVNLGGLGLSLLGQVLIEEEIGRTALPVSICNEPAICFLTQCSTTQRDALLPAIVAGDSSVSYALTEPTAGSDYAGIETVITVGEGATEDQVVVDGVKNLVVGLDYTDRILVVGKKAGTDTLIACLMDKKSPGVSIGRGVELLDGTNAFELTITRGQAPASNLVGPSNGVSQLLLKTSLHWNARLAAKAVGMGKRAVETGAEWAAQRRTFGDKLGNNEAIQFKIADSTIAVSAAQYMVYTAAWLADNGHDAEREIGAAKVFAVQAALRSADDAMQIRGGLGVSSDLPLATFYRRARQFQLESVPNELLKRSIASGMYGGKYLLGSVLS